MPSLKILNEESAKLLSTMDIDVIAKNLMEGARRIAPSEAVSCGARAGSLEILSPHTALSAGEEGFQRQRDFVDIVVKNREVGLSLDVRNDRSPLMPFAAQNTGSVFVLRLFTNVTSSEWLS
jgi:hypothetical protein